MTTEFTLHRTSPNVLMIEDRVRISAHHDEGTTGGLRGTIRGFDGAEVLVQVEGTETIIRVPFEFVDR